MDWSMTHIIFYLLVVDSVVANWIAWCGQRWYVHHVGFLSRYFPPAKGWAAYYFIWVIVLGFAMGVLPF